MTRNFFSRDFSRPERDNSTKYSRELKSCDSKSVLFFNQFAKILNLKSLWALLWLKILCELFMQSFLVIAIGAMTLAITDIKPNASVSKFNFLIKSLLLS